MGAPGQLRDRGEACLLRGLLRMVVLRVLVGRLQVVRVVMRRLVVVVRMVLVGRFKVVVVLLWVRL